MTEIRLQDYTAKIKELVREDRHDEAIAHCQHILRHHPKYIEVYCLLGETCLEKAMYREAIEFFQRTLSADPENFIARVGLGIIYDEQGALLEAIWQIERAFELAPGNPEVRRELQRLYAQRDGMEKSRLKLTRGALGRLYSRNGLYERAISEFHAILRHDSELTDVQVALAEALWRDGRRLEAVEVCLELLGGLPNCLKANLILGEIWTRGGHEDAGEEKLNVARALDPENMVAQELMGRDSPLPPEEVLIAELEVSRAQVPLVSATGVTVLGGAGWGTDSAQVEDQGLAEEGQEPGGWDLDNDVPDWLRDMGIVPEPGGAQVAAVAGAAAAHEASAEGVPDWLQELMGDELAAIAEEEQQASVPPTPDLAESPGGHEQPNWLRDIGALDQTAPAPVAGDADVPDWLREIEEPDVTVVLPSRGIARDQEREDMPDWLRQLGAVDDEPLAVDDLAPAGDEDGALPDWLHDLGGSKAPPPPAKQEKVVSDADLPDWLQVLGEPLPSETVAPQEPEGTEVPDWLRSLGAVDVPEVPAAPPDEERDLPDWLQALTEVEPTPAAPAAEAGEWRAEMPAAPSAPAGPAQDPTEIPESLRALVEAGILSESDLAAAVSEMSPTDLEAQRTEEVPAWLQDLLGEEPSPGVPAVTEQAAPVWPESEAPAAALEVEQVEAAEPAPGEAEGLPDWLRDLGVPRAAAAAAVALAARGEDVPDWLRDLKEPAPAAVAEPVEEEAELPAGEAAESPDWLLEMGEVMPAEPVEEEAELPAGEVAESPDWLLEMGEVMPAGPVEEGAELPAGEAEGLPDWLQDLGEPRVAAPAAVALAARGEDVPDWLRDLEESAPAAPVEEVVEPPAGEAVDLPDWLLEMGEVMPAEPVEEMAGPPAAPEVPVPPAAQSQAEIPESLRALVEAGILSESDLAAAMSEMSPTDLEAQRAEEVPAWLQDLLGEEPSPGVPLVTEEAAPVWPEPEMPAAALEIEEIEEVEQVEAAEPAPGEAEGLPDWLQDLGVPRAAAAGAVALAARDEDVPDWLQDLEEPAPVEKVAGPPAGEAEELPDWLLEMGEPAPVEEVTGPPADEAEELPDWLRDLDEVAPRTQVAPVEEMPEPPAAEVEELPDWLLELGESAPTVVAEPVEEGAGPPAGEAEELPDWLQDLGEPRAAAAAAGALAARGEDLPDWLQDLEESAPAAPAALAEPVEEVVESPASEAEELPDWLLEMGEVMPSEPVEQVAEPPAAEFEEAPDWLREIEPPAAPEVPVPSAAQSQAEIPESLRALVEAGILSESDLAAAMSEMSPTDLEAQRAEEVPAWLQDLLGEEPISGVPVVTEEAAPVWPEPEAPAAALEIEEIEEVEQVEAAEPAPGEAEGLPDWLQDLGVPRAAAAGAVALAARDEDVPDWLQDLEEPAPVEKVAGPPAGKAEELPDWLLEMGEPAPVEEVTGPPAGEAEELPDWLRDLDEVAPRTQVAPVEEMPEPPAVEELPDWQLEMGESAPTVLAEPVEEGAGPPTGEAEELPDWLQDLGEPRAAAAAAVALAARGEDLPDWLQDLEESAPAAPAALAAPVEEVVEPPAGEAVDLPDWLLEMGEVVPSEPVEQVAEPPAAEVEEAPGWLQEIEPPAAPEVSVPSAAQSQAEVPESLRALVEAGILSESDLAAAMSEMSPTDLEAQRAEEVPAWLQDLLGEEPSSGVPLVTKESAPVWPESEAPAAEVEELPDWLQETDRPAEVEPAPAAEIEAAPAWLQDLLGEEPSSGVPLVTEEAAPVWPESEAPAAVVEAEEVVDWLQETEPPAEPEPAPAAEIEAAPAWLQDLLGEEASPGVPLVTKEAAPVWPEPEAPAAVVEAEEVVDWLQETEPPAEPEPAPTAQVETVPDWLQDPGAQVPVPAPAEPDILSPAVDQANVPDSLRALMAAGILDEADLRSVMADMSPADLAAQQAEPVPDWLQDLLDEEPLSGDREPARSLVPDWMAEKQVLEPKEVRPAAREMPEWLREFMEDEARPGATPTPGPQPGPLPPPAEVVEIPAAAIPVEPPPVEIKEPAAAVLPGVEVVKDVAATVVELPPPVEMAEIPAAAIPVEPLPVEIKEPAAAVLRDVEVPEELAPTVAEPPPPPLEEHEPPFLVAPQERLPVRAPASGASRMQELREQLEARPRNHQLRLDLARLCAGSGDVDSALGHYEKLVAAGKLLPPVLEDLGRLAKEHEGRARIYQLMGDAYMHEDRLTDALDMYRRARQALLRR